MREAAVAPRVAVLDAELKSDDVEVGGHRAGGSRYPNPFWGAWAVETGADAHGSDRV